MSTPLNAIEVAVLVKAISLTQGADLIEQYARTVAAGARLDAVTHLGNRLVADLKEAVDAQD